jgi:hypothetical protein
MDKYRSILKSIPDKLVNVTKVIAICQNCKNELETDFGNIKRILAKGRTYLCRKCAPKFFDYKKRNEKSKVTLMKNYGVDNPLKNPAIKKKVEETSLKRYGETSITRANRAFKAKYGNINPVDIPGVLEKIKETSLARYGVACILATKENQEKAKRAAKEVYGHESPLLGAALTHNNCRDVVELANLIADYLDNSKMAANSPSVEEKFKVEGTTILRYLRMIKRDDLVKSYTITSSAEYEIVEYIKSLYTGTIIQNDRKTILGEKGKFKELDIFLPEKNIAIEYNGSAWHSEYLSSDPKRTHKKYQKCKELGIALYTIWDFAWETRKQQYKKFIKNLIIEKPKIYAKDTTLTIDQENLKTFVSENHLQGIGKPGSSYYGLMHNNKIVMAISIGRHHRKSGTVVLNRVCFSDITVVGGLEKLLKYQPHNHLITWSDNQYSPFGNLYQKTGFQLEEELSPDYSYVHLSKLIHKSKQSMKKSLIKCPPNTTEKDHCESLGYYRIWDCGKKRWSWTRSAAH